MEEFPEIIDVGLAMMVTVGAGFASPSPWHSPRFSAGSGRRCGVSGGCGRADRLRSAARPQGICTAICSGHRHLSRIRRITVKVDELPDVIEVGFAVMVTVGAGFGDTVTVARARCVPSGSRSRLRCRWSSLSA